MSQIKDSLNEAFEVEVVEDETQFTPLVPSAEEGTGQAIVPIRSNEDEDFEFARSNLRNLAEKGTRLLDKAIENAESSDHPRQFEVAGQILKALADINKDLIFARKIHRESKNMDKTAVPSSSAVNRGVVINADKVVYTGTTNDLLDKLK